MLDKATEDEVSVEHLIQHHRESFKARQIVQWERSGAVFLFIEVVPRLLPSKCQKGVESLAT